MNPTSEKPLPLLREAVLEPFIAAAKSIGAPVEKLLRSSGLPTLIAEDATLILPEVACWRFVESVAQTQGARTFGLLAGNSITHLNIPGVQMLATGCANLYELLRRFSSIAKLYSNNAHYRIIQDAHCVHFAHTGRRYTENNIQVQMFQVLGMVQLVQHVCGTNWQPQEVHFCCSHNVDIEQAKALRAGKIRFEQAYPGITIPLVLLATPVSSSANRIPDSCYPVDDFKCLPDSYAEGLGELILPYLGSRKISKTQLAERSGLSVRTLQRRLSEEHTTYAQILDQVRLEKAINLLTTSEMSLLDIALALSYENASGFSLAFYRWMGISPYKYRKAQAHLRQKKHH